MPSSMIPSKKISEHHPLGAIRSALEETEVRLAHFVAEKQALEEEVQRLKAQLAIRRQVHPRRVICGQLSHLYLEISKHLSHLNKIGGPGAICESEVLLHKVRDAILEETGTVWVVISRSINGAIAELEILDTPPDWELSSEQFVRVGNINGGDSMTWLPGDAP